MMKMCLTRKKELERLVSAGPGGCCAPKAVCQHEFHWLRLYKPG
jgi:hypothetical protein